MLMSQINRNPDDRGDRGDRGSNSRGALAEASRNLTWAIGAVIVIAALAFATVWVAHSLHPV
jgi:hypothetical protein